MSLIETISKRFPYQIWKIHYSQDQLLVELRDPDLRVLKLVCLSMDELEILSETDQDTLRWWDNVVHVYCNYVALSTYKDPKFPETQGVKILDMATGKFLWKQDNWRVLEGSGENLSVVVDASQPLEVEKIQITNGKLALQNLETTNSDLFLPELYTEGEIYFDQVKEFLESKEYTPVKTIEYLDYKSAIIIGIYQSKQVLDKQETETLVLIFDNQGDLINSYKCGDTGDGIGMGLFFVVKDRLVFVRDKKEIVFLELSHCNKR